MDCHFGCNAPVVGLLVRHGRGIYLAAMLAEGMRFAREDDGFNLSSLCWGKFSVFLLSKANSQSQLIIHFTKKDYGPLSCQLGLYLASE